MPVPRFEPPTSETWVGNACHNTIFRIWTLPLLFPRIIIKNLNTFYLDLDWKFRKYFVKRRLHKDSNANSKWFWPHRESQCHIFVAKNIKCFAWMTFAPPGEICEPWQWWRIWKKVDKNDTVLLPCPSALIYATDIW